MPQPKGWLYGESEPVRVPVWLKEDVRRYCREREAHRFLGEVKELMTELRAAIDEEKATREAAAAKKKRARKPKGTTTRKRNASKKPPTGSAKDVAGNPPGRKPRRKSLKSRLSEA